MIDPSTHSKTTSLGRAGRTFRRGPFLCLRAVQLREARLDAREHRAVADRALDLERAPEVGTRLVGIAQLRPEEPVFLVDLGLEPRKRLQAAAQLDRCF